MKIRNFFHFEKKFGWSELIAIVAIVLSGVAIWQSYFAQENVRILNKLDFRPALALNTQLHKIDEIIPAYINIKNTGPVDAIQVQIQFYFLKYLPSTKKVKAAATGSDLQWAIDRLPSLKQANIKIDETSLTSLLPAINSEKHHRILEIRLIYRREVDLKKYSESAFYFFNQEGRFVGENDNSLDPQIYNPIKEAAFKRFNIDKMSSDLPSDILHELSEGE